MATEPADDEPMPTSVDRIRRTLAAPVSERSRATTLLALAAGLATLAPPPLGGLAAALLVIVAADQGRRK